MSVATISLDRIGELLRLLALAEAAGRSGPSAITWVANTPSFALIQSTPTQTREQLAVEVAALRDTRDTLNADADLKADLTALLNASPGGLQTRASFPAAYGIPGQLILDGHTDFEDDEAALQRATLIIAAGY